MNQNSHFGISQFSSEHVGFGRPGERQLQLFMRIRFGKRLMFHFGLEPEKGRHDIRTLDVNHKPHLSLKGSDQYICD